MTFRINDRVTHRYYPNTQGTIVSKQGSIIIVLWDSESEPGNSNNNLDLPARSSRHIPWALVHLGGVTMMGSELRATIKI